MHGHYLHSFVNPYSYLLLRKNKSLISDIDYFFCDGALMVVLLNLFGLNVHRYSFDMTSLAPLVFEDSVEFNKSVYFIGSEPGIVEKSTKIFHEAYPKLNICGSRHGFFNSDSDKEQFIRQLFLINPDVVIVGMGTPFQEKFLIDLRKSGWNGVGFTCGGFLHQTAKKGIRYYPKIMNQLNLRWLYRMYDEPKLIARYFYYYPWFVIVCAYDVFLFKMNYLK